MNRSDVNQDQFGEETKNKYSSKAFKKLLTEISQYPVEKQSEILEKEFPWKGNEKRVDDILVIGGKM
ncbi:hypothetical protein ACFLSE_05905 [Bacteroidota bacterium]